MAVTDLIQSIRPKQWAKNIIVFAALIFSKNCFAAIPLFKTLATFVLFCGLSSAVYLLNDCLDIERDRLHPVKAKRPIASGRVAIGTAITFAVVLAVASLAGSFLLQPKLMVDLNPSISSDQNSALLFPSFFVVASSYLVLFVLYSVVLKNIVILDVLIIAIGFVLRAVAGAVAIEVSISSWLFICTIFLSLFLALCKRRNESLVLTEQGANHRKTLSDYDVRLLDQMIAVVAACCLMSYALYTTAVGTIHKFHSVSLVFTIPFVIYGIFRYLYLVQRKEGGGDPSQQLLGDKPLLINILLWGIASIAVIYKESLLK